MKIITFWGGLGNTILEYAYYLYLKEKYPNEKFYSFFPKAGLTEHNGFELDKHFDVKLPKTTIKTNIIGILLFYAIKVLECLRLPFPFTTTMDKRNDDAIFHCDFFQNKDAMVDPFPFTFKNIVLNERNKKLLNMINSENSIAIHIRRGDYLNPKIKSLFDGICTEKYYTTAISYIQKHIKNPHYVFFSDDTHFVKEKYKLRNMTIVDWNTGTDSYLDMFMMSHCKNMILANSTFSYCAARFNKNANIIICPERWNNNPLKPNLTMDNWIVITSLGDINETH